MERLAISLPSDCAQMRIHLIGIGGSGLCGAAALLLALGARVSGSDLVPFEGMGSLVESGVRIAIGHRPEQLGEDTNLVVTSAAIPASNPELTAARARGVTIIKYAELVGALMKRYAKGVAIAGTHGKSTTTAMCAHLFRRAGFDPTFLIGARSDQLGGHSGIGSGPHLIVESCEFDRSFLHLFPESAAILNIEPDHLDYYRDLDEIVEAFSQFGTQVEPEGLLVCHRDDPWAMRAAQSTGRRIETFGLTAGADWQAVNLQRDAGCYAFEVQRHGTTIFPTRLSIPGKYNVVNALAAVALAHHAGATYSDLAQALPTFTGIRRRLTWRGVGRGVTVVDDYAHHPTEIRLTLEAAKEQYQPRRTWVSC